MMRLPWQQAYKPQQGFWKKNTSACEVLAQTGDKQNIIILSYPAYHVWDKFWGPDNERNLFSYILWSQTSLTQHVYTESSSEGLGEQLLLKKGISHECGILYGNWTGEQKLGIGFEWLVDPGFSIRLEVQRLILKIIIGRLFIKYKKNETVSTYNYKPLDHWLALLKRKGP